jgi:hypothetical protein
MTLGGGRLHRLRLGVAFTAIIRTGLAGQDLRSRPGRCVRPRWNNVLDPAAAGAGGEQRGDDEYRDDRHAMPPPALRRSKPANGGKIGRPLDLAALPAECSATLPRNPLAHAVSEREPDGQGEGKLHHYNTIAIDISV